MTHALRSCLLVVVPMCWPFVAHSATTRVEENDASIVYTGNWYTNTSSSNSASRSVLTNDQDAQATISFTGTGISWIGVADPWSGLARVYVDGVLNTIDTYASDTAYQKVLFAARGLAAGPHTLSIQVSHSRDPNGSGSWVWIDAFDIEGGSAITGGITAPVGRIEQNNPAITYAGTWFLNNNPAQSGGTAVLAMDAGSRASISFTGAGIRWLAYRDEWSGIAKVYLDGALADTVDNYVNGDFAQSVGFEIIGLSNAKHTLSIEVTGTHSANSHGSWVWVDAFDVIGTK